MPRKIEGVKGMDIYDSSIPVDMGVADKLRDLKWRSGQTSTKRALTVATPKASAKRLIVLVVKRKWMKQVDPIVKHI